MFFPEIIDLTLPSNMGCGSKKWHFQLSNRLHKIRFRTNPWPAQFSEWFLSVGSQVHKKDLGRIEGHGKDHLVRQHFVLAMAAEPEGFPGKSGGPNNSFLSREPVTGEGHESKEPGNMQGSVIGKQYISYLGLVDTRQLLQSSVLQHGWNVIDIQSHNGCYVGVLGNLWTTIYVWQ